MVSRTIYLNMVPSSVRPVVYVSQYDVDTSCLFFYLYNGSDIYSIPSGYVVTINGAKPDNTAFSYNCTYSGNKVTSDLKEQMTLVKGDVTCEISIQKYSTGQIIGSANFVLRVEESPWFKATMSKTDVDNLQVIIKQGIDEVTKRAETAANSANTSAVNAKGSANSAAASAASAKQTADSAKTEIRNTVEQYRTYADDLASGFEKDVRDTTEQYKAYVANTSDEFKEEAKNLAEKYSREAVKDSESWAVGGTGTRTGEDTNNSKYYSELSKNHSLDAANSAQLAKDYSTIVMPDLMLDPDTGILYEKAGVGIDVKLDQDTSGLYWKITVGS